MDHVFSVSEIFSSIQGEGDRTGVPSFFIRLAGCNMACKFCDSKFASYSDRLEYNTMNGFEIIAKMKLDPNYNNITDVVITGGEPMILKNLTILTQILWNENKYITIETNGSVYRNDLKCIELTSISPKLSNSIPDKTDQFYEKHIKAISHTLRSTKKLMEDCVNFPKCQLKFVYDGSERDEQDILAFVENARAPSSIVYIMPKGISNKEMKSASMKAIDFCKRTGFTFCGRLHIYLWGKKRGV